MRELRELERESCERLLRRGVAGRVAFSSPDGPHIVPVNYSVVDDRIVVCTTPYSLLGTYGHNAQIAFEIDEFDYEDHVGWSVVARGRGEAIADHELIQHIKRTGPPRPWATGQRILYMGIKWTELTGRSLGVQAGEAAPTERRQGADRYEDA